MVKGERRKEKGERRCDDKRVGIKSNGKNPPRPSLCWEELRLIATSRYQKRRWCVTAVDRVTIATIVSLAVTQCLNL